MSKILIIEDEASIRRVLNKVLLEENDKFQITEASDGVQAVDEIKKKKFIHWKKSRSGISCTATKSQATI